MSVIRIFSEIYSGQTSEITFFPLSGGVINIGIRTIPFEYENEYFWGNYELYFPQVNETCYLTVYEPIISPTPTPSFTPTPTNPCVEYLTDEFGNYILTESGDFIVSEVNPCITPTPTPTPTNPCVEFLTDEFGNFILDDNGDFIISEINTCLSPTPTPTSTSTPTITPTTSPTYYYYNLLDCDNTNNKVGRSILGGLTGTYNVDTNKCYFIVGIDLGPNYNYDLDTSTLISDCNNILCGVSPTPTSTPTNTPSSTPAPLVPLTLYIQIINGGESIIFDGVTYTSDTTVNILKNTSYNIESVPAPGYRFVGWNIFGGSFSSTGQSTTVSVSLDSGANLAPSYEVDPNYDALEDQLSSNLVNYQNATDNDWVSITQEEYNNIFNNVSGVIKIGNNDTQINTRDLATGFDTTTFGTIDALTPLTIPTGYYVVGFVAESWNQNGQVQLGYTTTYHTGAPTYMGNSPNVIGGMTMFYVRKRPSFVEGAPASQNLYPVLNFISPAYPNAVPNTYGWQTYDGGTTWLQTDPANQTAKIQILLTNVLSWPAVPPAPTPSVTTTPTVTPTPTITPNCLRQIVVPTLWDGNTIINTNLLQLTQTSETLQIQVGDTITDINLNTSIVGLVSSDGTYTYVGTGPGGSIAFNCEFPLTFSGPC